MRKWSHHWGNTQSIRYLEVWIRDVNSLRSFLGKTATLLLGTLRSLQTLLVINSLWSPWHGRKPGEAELQCHCSSLEKNILASLLCADLLGCHLGNRGRSQIVTQLQQTPQNIHGKLWSWDIPSEMSQIETGSELLYSQSGHSLDAAYLKNRHRLG